jgi:hypothetical protein
MYDIKLVGSSPTEINQCYELLHLVFSAATHITPAFLDWEYNQNPAGKAVGFNAYDGDVLAAHYVTIPLSVRLFGHETKGLLSLNTATHPAHQGKRLFTTLAAQTYEQGAKLGYEFVVGVANANSTHGFVNKLGFQLVAPLEARVGMGTVRRTKRSKSVNFERIWATDSLSWRFKNPSLSYRYLRHSQGFAVVAPTGRMGIQAELGQFPHSLRPQKLVLSSASQLTPCLWLGLDASVNWRKSLYFTIPHRWRPSPLNFIFKDLTGANRKLNAYEVIFQTIDFDAY